MGKPTIQTPHGKRLKLATGFQWEADGVLKLETAARVRAIQEHSGQKWVFIEGSETGIPVSQIRVEQKGVSGDNPSITPPTLAETPERPPAGEREWLRGPLGRDIGYRLFVSGELGPKEIGKLIKVLKAQQAVLSDDDNDEDDEAAN